LDGSGDFLFRKNEAIGGWVVGFSFGLVHFDDVDEVI
jgi:hypothetical protein